MVQVEKLVKLISFNGTRSAPSDVMAHENYWCLIGEQGIVLETQRPNGIDRDRVLVRFNANLDELGLETHNDVPNTLWIKQRDLVEVAVL
jgi:hypothetical protein